MFWRELRENVSFTMHPNNRSGPDEQRADRSRGLRCQRCSVTDDGRRVFPARGPVAYETKMFWLERERGETCGEKANMPQARRLTSYASRGWRSL